MWTILKSGPVWALILLNFSVNFTNNFQLSSLPTYYDEILGFSVHTIAVIFAVSSLIRFGTGLSFSYLGDVFVKKDVMGLTTQRKFFCIFCTNFNQRSFLMIGLIDCVLHFQLT